MRRKIKRLVVYAVSIGFLLNFFIAFFYSHQPEIHSNEFLILDWTGRKHVFQEHDPIYCNFSHITPSYCQLKFSSFIDLKLRSELIDRCTHLSTLILRWTADQTRLHQANLISYHSINIPPENLPKLNYGQFSMVYILESEVYSSNDHRWHEINFPIWYNLQQSYPEPATYFDLNIYLKKLFQPIQVPFNQKKTSASIVWISSNCRAYNGRHLFVEKLMSYIKIDSYGRCLNNIQSDKKISRNLNTMIYSQYKFVIAIENSNCEDYVTEKLIEAFSSTSIPIIAGRDGKPDYQRFAPYHSYINVYDYPTIEQLANYLKYLSNNQTAYNEYLWFRSNETLVERSLTDYLHLADKIFGVNSTIRQWLLTKETNRNKYCKLTEFIYTNDWKSIYEHKKIDRPSSTQMCLPKNDLIK